MSEYQKGREGERKGEEQTKKFTKDIKIGRIEENFFQNLLKKQLIT